MAIKLGDAILFLAANDKELAATLNKTEKTVEKFTEKTNTLGGRIGNMFSGSIGKMAAFGAGMFSVSRAFSFAVSEISESQLAAQQLNAVLESTGGIAGVTASQVNNLGTQLASLSNFSDDAIISGSSLMLTFTQIGSAVFPRAMQAALDLATAMNTDMKSAVLQVGKALNDPVKGMNALTRAGIQFTESQRTAISEYIKANDLLSAQGVILAELEKQLGGSAAAAANTFTGSVQDLMDALGNLAEELEPVLNLVTRVVDGFTNMVQIVTSPIETFKLLFNNYDELEADAKKREEFSRSVNKAMRRTQMMEYGANLTTAEGTTREEYDAKYAAAEAKAQAEREAEAKILAEAKAKELTPEQRYNIAARAAYTAYATGEPAQGPQTMEESAESAASQYRGYSHRAAQRMRQPQRGGPRVVISHANFTAGPDQIRAYNQRRAMMPGF